MSRSASIGLYVKLGRGVSFSLYFCIVRVIKIGPQNGSGERGHEDNLQFCQSYFRRFTGISSSIEKLLSILNADVALPVFLLK